MNFKVFITLAFVLDLVRAHSVTSTHYCGGLEARILVIEQEIRSLKNGNGNQSGPSAASSCIKYSFRITSEKLSFDASRQKCRDLGGDLIQDNLKPSGIEYHNQIRKMIDEMNDDVWVGLKDDAVEGEWRFLNGEIFEGRNSEQPSLYFWGKAQPDSGLGNEDCAGIGWMWDEVKFNEGFFDHPCSNNKFALCEMKYNTCV